MKTERPFYDGVIPVFGERGETDDASHGPIPEDTTYGFHNLRRNHYRTIYADPPWSETGAGVKGVVCSWGS